MRNDFNLDYNRIKRTGIPEVIFCEGKTPEQTAKIFLETIDRNNCALATRANKDHLQAIKKIVPDAEIFELAKIAKFGKAYEKQDGNVVVATGGTSDIPVAEEAALTLEFLGLAVNRIYDVGVAGLDRILARKDDLNKADIIIVVAGMDGALPSVVAGLTNKLVIGVPAPVGYGAGEKGYAALLAMLNSCAPGLVVVNIGNGFGAACAAAKTLIK